MERMSYQDLPEDIRSTPLTEGGVRGDVVDLILDVDERRRGAIAVMVCDELDRGVQPLVVGDLGTGLGVTPLVEVLDLLLPVVAHEGGSVLVARGRGEPAVPDDEDRAWHRCALDACERHRVRLLGFFLATPAGVEELAIPLGATA
jgi:hypothetical protein